MKYNKEIVLRNNKSCLIRNGYTSDALEVIDIFNQTHAETDFLLSYPEENSHSYDIEVEFLKACEESKYDVELLAILDGKIVGTAGISLVGYKYKVKHRSELGISIKKEYWGLGIGKALMEACIECAKNAGLAQLELDVVADNHSAIALYKKFGFIEFGRNPKGFNSKVCGYQETVLMRLELN